jgi:soluble lytic murein transglycosylase-like protein
MTKRILPLVLLLFAMPPCAHAQPDASQAEQCVRRYAAHYRVQPELIAALIDIESRWNPRAVSNKGAMGLMQLMPATARRYGANHPFDVEENIAAGTRYVTALMWEFHGDIRLVSAAYYAGDRWVSQKQLNYSNLDVVAYVEAVRLRYTMRKRAAKGPQRRWMQ